MSHVPSNQAPDNKGVVTYGGTTQVTSSAIGDNATVSIGSLAAQEVAVAQESRRTWDVGVVTILPVETRAVTTVLGLQEDTTIEAELESDGPTRQRCSTGTVTAGDRTVNVVATRTLEQGQQSVIPALQRLLRSYNPAVLALVGIGGGIHADLALDDVVVATRVVYYDRRKDTPQGVRRRGNEHPAPAWVGHAVNAFFSDHGEPAELDPDTGEDPARRFRVFTGPIGSGDAVIANAQSEIRRFLTAYNDKTLALDMEAGGLSQFCHELSATTGSTPGWVVIRGISDHADHAKADHHHRSAAMHAAHTLRSLLPYLHTNR